MGNIYETPQSKIIISDGFEFTFSSLGIWRKIYLVWIWVVALFFALVTIAILIGAVPLKEVSKVEFTLFISALIGHTIWLTYATVSRKVGQLWMLSLLSLFPLISPIGAVIIASIATASKRDLKSKV
ncbi:MAG: hypothetical protein U5M23_13975 [Marinagarivorans sp.]|nr:hypothetical protein [Marinagarivorans sp.]